MKKQEFGEESSDKFMSGESIKVRVDPKTGEGKVVDEDQKKKSTRIVERCLSANQFDSRDLF